MGKLLQQIILTMPISAEDMTTWMNTKAAMKAKVSAEVNEANDKIMSDLFTQEGGMDKMKAWFAEDFNAAANSDGKLFLDEYRVYSAARYAALGIQDIAVDEEGLQTTYAILNRYNTEHDGLTHADFEGFMKDMMAARGMAQK